jgi:hypothetical protein
VPPYPQAVIDRPLLLPGSTVELQLLGNISSWDTSPFASTFDGESGALGLEIGFGTAQVGVMAALPLQPGFGFGSVLASAAIALTPRTAVRIDLGVDHVNANGVSNFEAVNFYYAGFGLPFEVRLSPYLALVSGRVGAANFAHVNNIGTGGNDFYRGLGFAPFESADLLTLTTQVDGGSQVAVNLPIGLLLQVAQPFSLTFRSGYEGFISSAGGGTAHFIPLGIDAVVSVGAAFDFGASFSFAGEIKSTSAGAGFANVGYTDIRMATVWLRVRPL